MRLVCISDTHGDHEQVVLPAGDVLIHAGDVTGHGTAVETRAFMRWLGDQPFSHKLCVAGNHDTFMENDPDLTSQFAQEAGVLLLNDSGVKLSGVSFWGSPITPRFFDWSFMRDPGAHIEAHWNLIPKDTDVLITHGPPFGILDQVQRSEFVMEHTGCPSLLSRVQKIKPLIHLFGHIHEGYGRCKSRGVTYYNVSTMNERYRINNPAVAIELGDQVSGERA